MIKKSFQRKSTVTHFWWVWALLGMSCVEASPWLPNEGSRQWGMSIVEDSYDQRWDGSASVDMTGPINISTVGFHLGWGLSRDLAVDVFAGIKRLSQTNSDVLIAGVSDSSVRLSWTLVDEFYRDQLPTISVSVEAVLGGNYELSFGDSGVYPPGDGANGLGVMVSAGKVLGQGFSLMGDVGLRYRHGVRSDAIFSRVAMAYSYAMFSGVFTLTQTQDFDGVDANDAAFDGDFSSLKQEVSLADLGLGWTSDTGYFFGINYAQSIEGRNVGRNALTSLTMTVPF
jgi:hypothetical protein